MRNRIIAAVTGLSLAIGTVLPAGPVLAGPDGRAGAAAGGGSVVQVDERDGQRRWRDRGGERGSRWRDRDRNHRDRDRAERRHRRGDDWRDRRQAERWRDRRHERRQAERWRDRRQAERWHDRRQAERWHDRRQAERWRDRRWRDDRPYRHRHRRDRDHDAAPYIIGGVALGALLLMLMLDDKKDHDRGDRRYGY